MKFLFQFLIALSITETVAQDYFPLEIENRWDYLVTGYGHGGPIEYAYTVKIVGDTLIGGKKYFIIDKQFGGVFPNRFVRVKNDSLYFISNHSFNDCLLFAFNLPVGTTYSTCISTDIYFQQIIFDSYFGYPDTQQVHTALVQYVTETQRFSKKFGLLWNTQHSAYANTSSNLKGCIISGITYGELLFSEVDTIKINPLSLDFGNVTVGSDSTVKATINNTGSIDLIISNIISSDDQFTFTPNTFPITISPGVSQVVNVTFSPGLTGLFTGDLTFTYNASGSPTAYPYQGTGVKPVNNSFMLEQNYPNPFNPSTKISFVISHSSFVTLKVYDVLGNEIATLVNEEKPAGDYEVEFNAVGTSRDLSLPSGIYFYQLKSGSFVETKKMMLLK